MAVERSRFSTSPGANGCIANGSTRQQITPIS